MSIVADEWITLNTHYSEGGWQEIQDHLRGLAVQVNALQRRVEQLERADF